MSQIVRRRIFSAMFSAARHNGEWGSGAGKGGGSGGSVRDAGGSFGKMESAREEQYYRKLQAEQIAKLKGHLHEEINHQEEEIKRLQDEIARRKRKIADLSSHEAQQT